MQFFFDFIDFNNFFSFLKDSYLKSTNSLQQFCQTAATVIQNPFLLQEIAFDSAHYLSRNNPTQFSMILCSPMLNILVQRCLNL